MKRKTSLLLLLVAAALIAAGIWAQYRHSKAIGVDDIVGTWKPSESFYRRLEAKGAAAGHLTGPIRVVYRIDSDRIISYKIEGDVSWNENYEIVERNGDLIAKPFIESRRPEIPLRIVNRNTVVLTHPVGGEVPMERFSE